MVPTRSGSSATPCSSSGPRTSPTSTARSSSLADDMIEHHVRRARGSVSPLRRSACRSACSSTTSTTTRAPGPRQPRDHRDPRRVDLRGGLPVGARALVGDRAPERGPHHRLSTSTATRCRSRPTSSWPACFQHELDHLDGVLLSSASTTTSARTAKRAVREMLMSRTAGPQPGRLAHLGAADRPGAARSRLVYLGTPEMAVPPLRALVDAGFEVASWCQPSRQAPRPRERARRPSPVKAAALELGLPVTDASTTRSTSAPTSAWWSPSGGSSSRTCSTRCPMVNMHFSLLPRWRGAAPVERAILAGDTDRRLHHGGGGGLDTGGVYARAEVPSGRGDGRRAAGASSSTVGTDAARRGAAATGSASPSRRSASRLRGEDRPRGARDRLGAPAAEIDRLVRVGGAWTTFRASGSRSRRVADARRRRRRRGRGHRRRRLELLEVQPEGKGRMAAAAWRTARDVGQAGRAPRLMSVRPGGRPRRPRPHRRATARTPTSLLPQAARSRAASTSATALRHRARVRRRRACGGPATGWSTASCCASSTRRCGPRCASAPTSSRSSTRPPHAAVGETVDAGAEAGARPRQRRAPQGRGRAASTGPTTPRA